MPLIVEDGSGVASAQSYVSVDAAAAFFGARDLTVPTEAMLLRAMDTIEALRFKGVKASASNTLAWPRTTVLDVEGVAYPITMVPRAIVEAQLWLAHYIGQGSDPGAVAGPAIKKEVVDVIETEYAFASGASANTAITLADLPNVYARIEHLLLDPDATSGATGGFSSVRLSHA